MKFFGLVSGIFIANAVWLKNRERQSRNAPTFLIESHFIVRRIFAFKV
jgi:hypothetical protein